MIVALAGGVGGAKLAQGLAIAAGPENLAVVVNTGDDFDLYGLRICPDLDTVMYTLAGIADPVNGWGIANDSTRTLDAIAAYGRNPWFRLGDGDFATHILRTEGLRNGSPLSAVTADLAAALGVRSCILPMTDRSVATRIRTTGGELDFQDYFVARRQQDDVVGVRFAGIEAAAPAPGMVEALGSASAIVFCPSNPFVSVGPILSVPGVREAVAASPAPKVAVSPIVGGVAIKGPAARMLASMGHEVSPVGVAKLYAGLIDGFVLDESDAHLAPRVEAIGMRALATPSVMGGSDDRARLAARVLQFAVELRRESVGIDR